MERVDPSEPIPTATVTDNSGETLTAVCTSDNDVILTLGANTITCKASDAAGNEGTCDYTITLKGKTSVLSVLGLLRFV